MQGGSQLSAGEKFRHLIPARIRNFVKEITGIAELQARISILEDAVPHLNTDRAAIQDEIAYESGEERWERSRQRWRDSEPTAHLTWGMDLSGESFIAKAASYAVFGDDMAVLEIGPGYGRLLGSILSQKAPFKRYVGVDLSAKHVEYLRDNFRASNIDFVHGDAETLSLDGMFDVVLSSLTLKHIFPSFEAAIKNIRKHVNPGGMFVFDLLEGTKKYFESGGKSTLRQYTKPEIGAILERASLELVAFDEVEHAPRYRRLLVVAKKGNRSLESS
jgi:SAM-dependent methyltransferase